MKCYEVKVSFFGETSYEALIIDREGVIEINVKVDYDNYTGMIEELLDRGHVRLIPKKKKINFSDGSNIQYDDYEIDIKTFESVKEVLEYCSKELDLEYKEVNCDS